MVPLPIKDPPHIYEIEWVESIPLLTKARQADESGVKVGCAFTAHEGLIVGARSFRVNLCGGDTLVEELE